MPIMQPKDDGFFPSLISTKRSGLNLPELAHWTYDPDIPKQDGTEQGRLDVTFTRGAFAVYFGDEARRIYDFLRGTSLQID